MDDLCRNFTSRSVAEELEPFPFAPEGFADGTSKGLAWLDCCSNWLEFSILVASALPLGAMLSTLRGRFKNSWQLKLHLRMDIWTFGHDYNLQTKDYHSRLWKKWKRRVLEVLFSQSFCIFGLVPLLIAGPDCYAQWLQAVGRNLYASLHKMETLLK